MTTKKSYTYDILRSRQGKFEIISFFAPAKELWSFVSINQKTEDEEDEDGYQRFASAARVKAISRFVDAGNPIPLSILVTLEKRSISLESKKVTINASKKAGWVIDGQHRLLGAKEATGDILLPVVAFIGLSIDEQINQFVTINKEAKGVPTSLYYSLLKKLPPRLSAVETAKERAADVAMILRNDEESPFASKIVITTSPKSGQLSLVNFVRKVSPLVKEDNGLLSNYSPDEQAKIIDNYYLAIRNVFAKSFDRSDSVFFQTAGFGAMLNFFQFVWPICLSEKNSFAVSDVTEILQTLSHIDVEKWRTYGSGNAVETSIHKDLVAEYRSLTDEGRGTSRLKLD